MLLGLNKDKPKYHAGINWGYGPFKSLGIYFGTNSKVTNNLNWEATKTTIDKLLMNWKKRKLTLIGKKIVIESLLIPKITFLASVHIISKSQITEINKITFAFLWDNKVEKVKRNILINKVENGGLNIRDIDSHIHMLNINWVKRLCNDENNSWKHIPKLLFEKFGKNLLIFKMSLNNLKTIENIDNLTPFYKGILESWIKINGNIFTSVNDRDIRKEVLWGNKNVYNI